MGEALYLSEGKQRFRELLRDLAVQEGVRTVGTFYGTGVDSRLFAAAGLDVLAMEKVQAHWPAMDADAAEHGFRVFHGRARTMREHLDMVHADFIGGPSPDNFRELRYIAAITDRLLPVTLSPDHQLDRSMQGESALYTVPAWLTGATGFTLDYFGRYVRNRVGQTMFVAILRRTAGHGNSQRVQPVQIARSVTERRYWASRWMYDSRLLVHMQQPRTPAERARDAERYLARKALRPSRTLACRHCGSLFIVPQKQGRPATLCSAECRRLSRVDAHARWYAANHDWELRRRRERAVYGTAREATKAA